MNDHLFKGRLSDFHKYHPEQDMGAYYDIKDPVCDIIHSGAEQWADATDWQPGPSDC